MKDVTRWIRRAGKVVKLYHKELKTPNNKEDKYDATVDLFADLFHYVEAKYGPGSAQAIKERAWNHFIVEKLDA